MNRGATMAAALLAAATLLPAAAMARTPYEKYVLFCAGCHGYEGEGGGGGGGTKRIEAFTDKVGLFLKDSEGRKYLVNTGGVSSAGMTDEETAIVLNYVLQNFGGKSTPKDFRPYTTEEITGYRRNPVADPATMRRQIAARLAARGIRLAPSHWDD